MRKFGVLRGWVLMWREWGDEWILWIVMEGCKKDGEGFLWFGVVFCCVFGFFG